MDNKTNIDRIVEMESYLNEAVQAEKKLSEQLARMNEIRDHMIRLYRYYGSEAWYEDREVDLPSQVGAGVLSEDAVYDSITQMRDAAFQMLELATDILKNRI